MLSRGAKPSQRDGVVPRYLTIAKGSLKGANNGVFVQIYPHVIFGINRTYPNMV